MQIEKNIPIPKEKENKTSYPFKEMRNGDSIYFDKAKAKAAIGAAGAFKTRNYGWDYCWERVEGGIRIWCMNSCLPIDGGKPFHRETLVHIIRRMHVGQKIFVSHERISVFRATANYIRYRYGEFNYKTFSHDGGYILERTN